MGLLIIFYGNSQSSSTYPPGNLEAKIRGVATNDGITLRWVLTNYASWMWGNKYGYTIVSNTYKVNGREVA